jgi:hypothetical protein
MIDILQNFTLDSLLVFCLAIKGLRRRQWALIHSSREWVEAHQDLVVLEVLRYILVLAKGITTLILILEVLHSMVTLSKLIVATPEEADTLMGQILIRCKAAIRLQR